MSEQGKIEWPSSGTPQTLPAQGYYWLWVDENKQFRLMDDQGVVSEIGNTTLGNLTDVDLDTLQDGQVIVWDDTQQKWVNQILDAGANGATTLAELNDTLIVNPQINNGLSWDGSRWVNIDRHSITQDLDMNGNVIKNSGEPVDDDDLVTLKYYTDNLPVGLAPPTSLIDENNDTRIEATTDGVEVTGSVGATIPDNTPFVTAKMNIANNNVDVFKIIPTLPNTRYITSNTGQHIFAVNDGNSAVDVSIVGLNGSVHLKKHQFNAGASMFGNKLESVADPVAGDDCATKQYVDTAIANSGGGGSSSSLVDENGDAQLNVTSTRVTSNQNHLFENGVAVKKAQNSVFFEYKPTDGVNADSRIFSMTDFGVFTKFQSRHGRGLQFQLYDTDDQNPTPVMNMSYDNIESKKIHKFLEGASCNNNKIVEVATPTLPTDGVNKQYVDDAIANGGGGGGSSSSLVDENGQSQIEATSDGLEIPSTMKQVKARDEVHYSLAEDGGNKVIDVKNKQLEYVHQLYNSKRFIVKLSSNEEESTKVNFEVGTSEVNINGTIKGFVNDGTHFFRLKSNTTNKYVAELKNDGSGSNLFKSGYGNKMTFINTPSDDNFDEKNTLSLAYDESIFQSILSANSGLNVVDYIRIKLPKDDQNAFKITSAEDNSKVLSVDHGTFNVNIRTPKELSFQVDGSTNIEMSNSQTSIQRNCVMNRGASVFGSNDTGEGLRVENNDTNQFLKLSKAGVDHFEFSTRNGQNQISSPSNQIMAFTFKNGNNYTTTMSLGNGLINMSQDTAFQRSVQFNDSVNLNNKVMSGVRLPTQNDHVASKQYVDDSVGVTRSWSNLNEVPAEAFGQAGQILSTTGSALEWVDAPTGGGSGSNPFEDENGEAQAEVVDGFLQVNNRLKFGGSSVRIGEQTGETDNPSGNGGEIAIGYRSCSGNGAKTNSIGVGIQSMYNSSGSANIGIGLNAGSTTSGNYNVNIGNSAGQYRYASSSNVCIGYAAAYNGQGSENIYIGAWCGGVKTTGAVVENRMLRIGSKPNVEPENYDTEIIVGDMENDKLQLNAEVTARDGLILLSPNGTKFKLTVDDSGNLSTTAV